MIKIDGKDRSALCRFKGEVRGPEAFAKAVINVEVVLGITLDELERLPAPAIAEKIRAGAEAAKAPKKAEEKEQTKALEAKIGITLDELKRLPGPARAKLDELIAEKLKASYAAEEAQKVAKARAAEAIRQSGKPKRPRQPMRPRKKWHRFSSRKKAQSPSRYRAQANGSQD
jgi:hypothetical protein